MGLQAFSFNNFKQISESSVKSKNNEYFEHATKMAYGLPALMEAKDKIHYLNEILLLDRESEVYVTLD